MITIIMKIVMEIVMMILMILTAGRVLATIKNPVILVITLAVTKDLIHLVI